MTQVPYIGASSKRTPRRYPSAVAPMRLPMRCPRSTYAQSLPRAGNSLHILQSTVLSRHQQLMYKRTVYQPVVQPQGGRSGPMLWCRQRKCTRRRGPTCCSALQELLHKWVYQQPLGTLFTHPWTKERLQRLAIYSYSALAT